jgi:hypothetical protein
MHHFEAAPQPGDAAAHPGLRGPDRDTESSPDFLIAHPVEISVHDGAPRTFIEGSERP